jgi:hypothetical protein
VRRLPLSSIDPSEERTTSQATSTILILAQEALAAALLGLLIELDRYEPAFAHPNESPEEAVRRVRRALVILLDGSIDAAGSDVFHARARGTPVILFGTPSIEGRLRSLALERRLPWFTMPADRATVARLIQEAVASGSVRSGHDRRRPSAREGPDGTLIYRDHEGREWQVYDRRVGERRKAEAYRAFVNDAGEEWRYELSDEDAAETSAAALERQLAAAVKHGVG